ncbi:MAG: phosphoribosylglycinamide formyltransferase [Euryarchaeota archaeon]|jgi:phosphoribosylglycinamide formyltransferase-1|nr:phosphoribosylglycinamide formyltransferase [Euryarchaeota archaeon]|tara:strand:- start:124 stop:777 length:654 start_codon:yes stop_codon:yes gene_type:complete
MNGFQLPRVANSNNPLRLAVFISGSGSGMAALLSHQQSSNCAHSTELVVSNIQGVGGLQLAETFGVSTEVVELIPGMERTKHEDLILEVLEKYEIEAIILSGYMRILSSSFVEKWEGRILNIHPSLLPNFPGAHAHRDALKAGAEKSGCTVHFVDSGVDSGLIIAQSEVKILPEDDIKTLQNRIKKLEHTLYPVVIDAFCEGRLEIINESKIIIHDH